MPNDGAGTVGDDEVAALQTATRDLVAVALRSLDVLEGAVSLPQFRVLNVLHELGRVPSSRVAAALGIGASSVTRLADRLVAAGHLHRGQDPNNRSVVTLELTPSGQTLVDKVTSWRRTELSRILGQLGEADRASLAASLGWLHNAVRTSEPEKPPGPLPL